MVYIPGGGGPFSIEDTPYGQSNVQAPPTTYRAQLVEDDIEEAAPQQSVVQKEIMPSNTRYLKKWDQIFSELDCEGSDIRRTLGYDAILSFPRLMKRGDWTEEYEFSESETLQNVSLQITPFQYFSGKTDNYADKIFTYPPFL